MPGEEVYELYVDSFTPETIPMARLSITTDFGPKHAVITDLNGDGKPDLVIAHCCGATGATYLLGNGDGTFQKEVQFRAGPSPSAVAVADFDGDGKPDLAIAGFIGSSDGGSLITLRSNLFASQIPAAASTANAAGR